jgi:peptidoglycan/xylan/chitin deacetylase (PgdA/CDA1 family)
MWYIFLFLVIVLPVGFLLYRNVRRKNSLCIFMYHHIGTSDDGNPSGYFVSDEMFAQQLDFLLANGYHPVSLSEVENAVLNKTNLPERAVLLTFDDGYRNNCEYAYPLALARKIPFVIFLSTGEIGQKDEMLTWEQVHEMAASGLVEFAPHGVNHKRLRLLSDDEAFAELVDSKKHLEQESGRTMYSFCYPYGAFDRRVRKLVFRAGYKLDFGTRKGINALPWTGRRPLLRAHIVRDDSLKDFERQLKTGRRL